MSKKERRVARNRQKAQSTRLPFLRKAINTHDDDSVSNKAENGENNKQAKSEFCYLPDTVMSIHGWLANGKWQNNLNLELGKKGLKSAPYDYRFKLWPWVGDRRVEKFQQWYASIINSRDHDLNLDNHYKRPSIMAHSLGTWILAKALLKYPEIKFDKIFLFGSIIPAEYDWFKLILNDQVKDVYNETTGKDKVASSSFLVTRNTKPSANHGFQQQSAFIINSHNPYFGHSSFQYASHFVDYIKNKLMGHPPHSLIIVQGGSINDRLIAQNYLAQGTEIDQIVYNDKIYQACPVSIIKLMEWFEIENDIWTFMINTQINEVDGYINAIPVNKATYERFFSGELQEDQIKAEDILNYQTCREYYLLILSIAVQKSEKEGFILHRGKRAELLILAMVDKIEKYRLQGVLLRKMCAIAWTDMGSLLCRSIGMEKSTVDNTGHPIYEIDLDNLNEDKIKETHPVCRWWYKKILNLK